MTMERRFPIFTAILCLAFLFANWNCYAQTSEIEGRKKEIQKLEEEISYLDNQIKSTQNQQKNTLEELVLVQNKIFSRKRLLAQLDREIKGQNAEMARTQGEIKSLEQRLDTLEHYYNRMIYNAYKHRDTKVWFMYILASENLEQGYRRWNYLKNYSKSITAQAEKIRNLKEEQKRQLAKVQQLKNNNMKVQAARTQEYNTLTREEKQSQAFARSLDKKQKQYRQQLAQKRRESERLSKEVEKMIAAEIKRQQEIARRQEELAKKAKEEKQKQNVPAQENKIAQLELQEYSQTKKLSGNFAVNRGKLPFPVQQGVIIERFGEHPHPTLKNVKLPFNNGINISTKPGSSVKVVFDGVVKQVIAIPGYNQCVLVQHGQYFTFYCKLAKVGVKVSDKLSTGDIIGTLEENGSTAVLHFELWNGTTKQNPELWLEK